VVFPNPANGGEVQLLPPSYIGAQDVRIGIFTSAFRKIQDTTFPQVPAGASVTVKLMDGWGNELANGFYYLRVEVAGKRSIAKLLIIR
jgi:hypothetical protein